METVSVRFTKRDNDKNPSKLKQIAQDIQHAISEIESGISSLEFAASDLPNHENDMTAVDFLEELGLSATKRYSLMDVERLKIAVKWALEGE